MKIEVTETRLPEASALEAKASLELSITLSTPEEPIAIRIVPSGWSEPRTFHVITEFGDMEQSEYHGMLTAQQIKDRYDLVIDDSIMNMQIKTLHNDQELGKHIRNQYNKTRNQNPKI